MDQAVDLDVENLFSEGELDQTSLDQILPSTNQAILQSQGVSVTPSLVDCLADLNFGGYSHRITWSRQGHLAKISEDGSTVGLQCLRMDCKTQKWVLTESRQLDTVFEQATTLAWSPTGVDLAVVDIKGRISMFSLTTTCLDRLNETRSFTVDQPEELGQAIGTVWLTQDRNDRPRTLVQESAKINGRWTLNLAKAKHLGPAYPRGFMMVSRAGIITLLFQRPDTRYDRVSTALPLTGTPILSQATIAPTQESKLLVAVYTCDGVLSSFYVRIFFPPEVRSNPGGDALPTLTIEFVDSNIPILSMTNNMANDSLVQSLQPEVMMLTHLEIIPTTEAEHARKQFPMITAVFTSANASARISDPNFLHTSVIRRWTVSTVESRLHPKFEDISTRPSTSTASLVKNAAERLTDTSLTQIVANMQIVDSGMMIAITSQDGRTELWNPASMMPAVLEFDETQVLSMAQCGFSFEGNPSIISCLSPSACLTASIDADYNTVIHSTRLRDPNQPAGNDNDIQPVSTLNAVQDAAIASVVLTFSRSSWSNANVDEIVYSIFHNFQPQDFPKIASQLYHAQFGPREFISERQQGSELEKVVQKPLVAKVLSFHLALHNPLHKSPYNRETHVAHLWVWLSMHLRYVTTIFYIFYQSFNQPKTLPNGNAAPPPSLPPSYIDLVCGNIKWFYAVFHYIVQHILEVGDRADHPDMFDPPSFENNLGDVNGDGSQGLAAMLLNCHWSRSFIASIVKAMRAFLGRSGTNFAAMAGSPMGRVINTIQSCSTTQGLNLMAMERLIDPKWYPDSPATSDGEAEAPMEIAARQVEMMVTGIVPPIYQGTIQSLLKACFGGQDGLRAAEEINRLKLMCEAPDTGYVFLNMDDIAFRSHSVTTTISNGIDNGYATHTNGIGPRTKFPLRKLYDCHKKSIMFRGLSKEQMREQQVRKCVRCGSLSDDAAGMNREWPRSMVQFMARCVCDGYWILEKLGDGIENI